MKRRTERWMNWTVAVVLLTQVAMVVAWFALRPRHRDLFEDDNLELVTDAAVGTKLPHAHAEIRGESLRVHGRIIAEAASAAEQDGTVRVAVLSPDGSELGQASTEYRLSSKLPRGGGRFSVDLPQVPVDGSIVKLAWGPVTKQ